MTANISLTRQGTSSAAWYTGDTIDMCEPLEASVMLAGKSYETNMDEENLSYVFKINSYNSFFLASLSLAERKLLLE